VAGKGYTIPTIFTAVDGMTGPINGIATKMQIAFAKMERSARSIMPTIGGIQNALSNVGLYVGGYTIYRTVKGMIDVFADFQQANADLAAIMETTVGKNIALSKEARTLGLSLGVSATEVVRMQIELAKLGYREADLINMGPSIIAGSIALDASLERTSIQVGAITRNWDNFNKAGADSGKIVDMMAKAVNDSALDFTKLETGLRQSGPAANAAGVSYAETLAILEALSNSNIDASQSGTALRNILIESGKRGHTFVQVLQNILKHQNLLTASADKFGKRTAVSAIVIAKNLENVKKWATELENVKPGYAMEIVLKKLDTVKGSWKLATAAWDEFILSIEDGNGPIAQNLQTMIQIAGAMFLLGADTDASRTALKKLRPEVVQMADRMNFWVGILKDAAIALLIVQGLIWSLKLVTGLLTAVTWLAVQAQSAWNVLMKLSVVWTWLQNLALKGSVVALYAVRIATALATAAQWLFNAAMSANPLTIITIGVLALVLAYKKLTDSIAASVEETRLLAAARGDSFKEAAKPTVADKIMHMIIPGHSIPLGSISSKNSLDSIAPDSVAPIVSDTTTIRDNEWWNRRDSLLNALSGSIKMDINDPGNHVKRLQTSPGSFIEPKIDSTMGWGNRRHEE